MGKHEKYMEIAAYAGIASLLLGIPATILQILIAFDTINDYWLTLHTPLFLITAATSILFYWGFKTLGDETKNRILQIAAYLLILSILFTISSLTLKDTAILNLMFNGLAYITLGTGFIKLKEHYGTIALATGTLNIIAGFGILTIILAIPAIPLLIIADILGILILFKASGLPMGAIDKFFTKKTSPQPTENNRIKIEITKKKAG